MAGGKETPRQKMIGMMYLVLTALLALNVSKQIVAAFVTLNDKLDASATIINNKNEDTHAEFDKKRAALQATKGDMALLELWQGKATQLKNETDIIVSYLLSESNEMIKTCEGKDWVAEDGKGEAVDSEGKTVPIITKLRPLMEINGMDNYDIPTNMFVGGNPNSPVQRGLDIRLKIHEYRDKISVLMATYTQGKEKNWTFTPPADPSGLSEALKTCNPEDTAKIAQFFRALSLPEKLHAHEDGVEDMPWPSVIFDHAPIVAAAAMFTSLKLDVKNAESMATEYMLSKVEAPVFNFNKIEPLAFARTGYINQGDSLALSVMIAAYDSTETPKIKWGADADTNNEANWKEVTGKINLDGSNPGFHKVKGVIGVKEKGELTWKPWEFTYTVGQPMGVVAQPEMRVLYRGYNNVVEGTASGYDPSAVSLSGSGCSLSAKGNGQYIATVGSGTREATISISAKKEGGGSVSLGSFKFKVKPMPVPMLYLGGISTGDNPGLSSVKAQTKLSARYDDSVPLTNVTFNISGGTVTVEGIMKKGKITSGGNLDGDALNILKQSQGKQVTIIANYSGPDGVTKRTSLVFTTK